MKNLADIVARLRQLAADCGGVLLSITKRNRPSAVSAGSRVTFVQFGDYAEAFRRFERDEPENYYAQKYSVDFVGSLPSRAGIESVAVICVGCDTAPMVLPNGIHTVGLELYPKEENARFQQLVELVKTSRPTHLIVMTPCIPLISWGVRSGIRVLPMLADSFRAKGLKSAVEYKLLGTLLNARAIEFVANHNLAASLDLHRLGVAAEKIVPFDWPAVISPNQFEAKSAPESEGVFRLIYVGAVIESKGVGDVIGAISVLRGRNTRVTLSVIGRGEIEAFKSIATDLGVQDFVTFLGPRTHVEVVEAMRSHDAVVVPSRWSYPEGLPMTLYEALCTRTPLLTSDHPMFALKIRHGYNALVFPERHPAMCADRIEELLRSRALYARLSSNSLTAAQEYLCALKYDQLISAFVGIDSCIDLRECSLGSRYATEVARSHATH